MVDHVCHAIKRHRKPNRTKSMTASTTLAEIDTRSLVIFFCHNKINYVILLNVMLSHVFKHDKKHVSTECTSNPRRIWGVAERLFG